MIGHGTALRPGFVIEWGQEDTELMALMAMGNGLESCSPENLEDRLLKVRQGDGRHILALGG